MTDPAVPAGFRSQRRLQPLEPVKLPLFDAPRHLVWDAMTRPELIRQWLYAPGGWTMTVCEGDAKVGGSFRWAWKGPDGKPAL